MSLKRNNLTASERQNLLNRLLEDFHVGVLEKGAITAAARQFNLHKSTVSRLWKQWLKSFNENDDDIWTVATARQNCGRPLKYDREGMKESIKEIPANKQGTVRLLENQLGVSRATVHRLI